MLKQIDSCRMVRMLCYAQCSLIKLPIRIILIGKYDTTEFNSHFFISRQSTVVPKVLRRPQGSVQQRSIAPSLSTVLLS